METKIENNLEQELKITFRHTVEKEFSYLIELGYTFSEIEIDKSDLAGDSYVLHLLNPEKNRDAYLSVSKEGSEKFPQYVYISIHRTGKSKGFGDNHIVFSILCKNKGIELESLNEMRELNEEALENLKVILKEYATVIKTHFLPILNGEEWIERMYTPWR